MHYATRFFHFIFEHILLFAVRPSSVEEEKQTLFSHIFSEGVYGISILVGITELELWMCGLHVWVWSLTWQEDIEKELSTVSRASRGPGVSQHIMVPISVFFHSYSWSSTASEHFYIYLSAVEKHTRR